MDKLIWGLVVTVVILLGALLGLAGRGLIAAPPDSSAATAATDLVEREQTAGEVTISVVPIQVEAGRPLIFQVGFDTHTIELDFDAALSASAVDDQGGSYRFSWAGDPAEGHHRNGVLTSTQPLGKRKQLTLNFANIGGIAQTKFVYQW